MAATDYDFFLTRNELIEEAYRKVGLLADGETLSAGQLDTGVKKINSIIKSWGDDGVLLFSYHTDTFDTVIGQTVYDMPDQNGESFIEAMWWLRDGNELQLERMSMFEFQSIYHADFSGQPQFFAQFYPTNKIHLYAVPDQIYNLKYRAICKLKDWEDPAGESQFPSRWLSALKYALALEIAEDHQVPTREINHLQDRAIFEYRRARGKEIRDTGFTRVRGAY